MSYELVYTRQAHFVLGPTWYIVAGEVAFEEREACDEHVAHLLETLRIRS